MARFSVTTAATLAAAALLWASTAMGQTTCDVARYGAAGKYAACVKKKLAKLDKDGDSVFEEPGVLKCVATYAKVWAKVHAKIIDPPCTSATRFVDNGDGTITDNLTGLVWEKKDNQDNVVNLPDRHDADNKYTWTTVSPNADGTAFTDLLANVNGLAGNYDWRVPTLAEIASLIDPTQGTCGGGVGLCVDPIVGPTQSLYWSATPNSFSFAAWYVSFLDGSATYDPKTNPHFVRAVRGGL